MIVLSSLLAAPAVCYGNAASATQNGAVAPASGIYRLASANSAETNRVGRGTATDDRRQTDLWNGSDFPVAGRYQFARKAGPEMVSGNSDHQ